MFLLLLILGCSTENSLNYCEDVARDLNNPECKLEDHMEIMGGYRCQFICKAQPLEQ